MKEPWFGWRARSVQAATEEPSNQSQSDSSDNEVIDIKGDQFSNKSDEVSSLNLTSIDMIALGLTTAIGGHYFSWNAGLSIGFGGFLIVLFLIASAYYTLVLCIAELSSALPFAGGAYGIARVTLGIYPGFLVAVCDSYKSIIYCSASAFAVGRILTVVTQGEMINEYAYWVAFYVFCLSIHLYGGKIFWRVNSMLAVLSVLILSMYIFGSIHFADFEKYAAKPTDAGAHKWFHGGMYEFMQVLPLGTRFYMGIQSINLACGQIKNPKTEVPKGYLGAMTFTIFTSFAVLFLACSLHPGILDFASRTRPLTNGFKIMFALPRNRATIFNLPATIMSGFAFMYYYGQQLLAMGKSGLLNPWFGKELPGHNTPYVSLLVGSALGYMLCVIKWHYPDSEDQIYALSMLGAVTTYLSILASFIVFRWYFPTIKREFVSPVGTGGAVYGILVFLLCFISVCGFQKDQVAITVYGVIIGVSSLYYFFVVRKRQVFSEEEKTVMFKAYLLQNNAAKAKRIRKGFSKAAAGAGASGGARANNKTPTSKDRTEDNREMSVRVVPKAAEADAKSADSSVSKNGLKEDEQTPTSATVRLPYRTGTEPQAGSIGPGGLVQMVPTSAGVSSAENVGVEDQVTPMEGGSILGDERVQDGAENILESGDIEHGGEGGARAASPVASGVSSPYQEHTSHATKS